MRRTIDNTLRHAMIDSGLSKLELSQRSGVSRPSIIKFLRGECSLRLDMVDKLADVLDLELVKRKRR
jgi:transcriptional regulator with XRE-family HTH domain